MRTRGIDLAAELLESLPDPVIGCDADGTIVYWSRAAEDVYGYPAGEALGRRAATPLGRAPRRARRAGRLRSGRMSGPHLCVRPGRAMVDP